MDEVGNIKMLDSLEILSEKLGDAIVKDALSWVRSGIAGNHKPTIALVKFNLNHNESFRFLDDFLHISIPAELKDMIAGDAVCLILDYCETPMLLSKDDTIGKYIVFGIPCDFLKKTRIAICDEIQSRKEWFDLSSEIDVVCLVVNATMAMTQMEKKWLKECASCFYTEDNVLIAITNLDSLNKTEDEDEVRNTVSNYLLKINRTLSVYDSIKNAFDNLLARISSDNTLRNHDSRVLRNGLGAIKDRLIALNNGLTADQKTIDATIKQLQKKKKQIELAGQFTSETILVNAVNELKNNLCSGISDYEKQMVTSVVKTIESAPLDKLETMEDRINGYISGSWDYYIKTMSIKIDEEIEKIGQKLTKQIELDSEKIISGLDNSACLVMGEAFGLFEEDDDYSFGVRPANPFVDVRVKDVTDKLRKETRNMMLLSIPLFFVNPLISIGNIFASKVCEKFKVESEMEDIRRKMADMVKVSCGKSAEELIKQVELNFDDASRVGASNIRNAYNGLVEQIENNLNTWLEKQVERKTLKADIEVTIGQLMSYVASKTVIIK